jgi:hypothetical protein
MTFDGRAAADRIGAAVLTELERLPGFGDDLLAGVRAEVAAAGAGRAEAEEAATRHALDRVLDGFQKVGHSDALADRLNALEAQLRDIERRRGRRRCRPLDPPAVPTGDELKALARAAIAPLAADDPDFGLAMRGLLPEIVVFPFWSIDSDHVVVRARVTLDLGGGLAADLRDAAAGGLRHELWVDLFDPPTVGRLWSP